MIRSALDRITGAMDVSSPQIYLSPGTQVIPQAGLVGFTNPDDGSIQLTIDPDSRLGLDRVLEHWLPSQLAHELSHTERIVDGPGYGTTIGEAVVTEGIADVFATEIYPDVKAPWTRALTDDQERDALRRLQRSLDAAEDPSAHGEWFFGTGDLPNWTGYTLGYEIASSYVKRHAGTTGAELALLDAREILDESGIAGLAGKAGEVSP